ncbi:Hypothetical_protein [Hexamita inflata]|uniref:Hypothetical_protein n=1 Tax=Hexamita inflata TaxID=28002 RepID=A0AA86QNA4_9EUKA|nr:Hypothetical protein HINF_LOCUS47427 [Hexamita inflata]
MLFLQLVYNRKCEFGFPRMLGPNDSAQSSTANKIGAEKYLLCGIETSLWAVYDIVIPNITVVSEPTLILTNVYVIIALENQITVFMLIITYSINSAVHFFFTSSFK